MTKPIFYSPIRGNVIDAATNHFAKILMTDVSFGITSHYAGITSGTPTITLSVCSFNGEESDFIPIADATNVLLTDAIKASSFAFAYLGVKFTSNTSTGLFQSYLNTNE